MTVDLHAYLVAAVEQRLLASMSTERISLYWPRRWGKETLTAFWNANDPTAAIRHCERDLKVLERHRPNAVESEAACLCTYGCRRAWPCDDVRDLATAYGVETRRPPRR